MRFNPVEMIRDVFRKPKTWVERLQDIDRNARCPDCGSKLFYEGPHGGEAVNVKCAGCGRFWWYGGIFGFKPIDSDDQFFRGKPKKMEEIA